MQWKIAGVGEHVNDDGSFEAQQISKSVPKYIFFIRKSHLKIHLNHLSHYFITAFCWVYSTPEQAAAPAEQEIKFTKKKINIKLIAQDVSIITGICNYVKFRKVFKRSAVLPIKCIMNNNVTNINK